MNRIVRDSRGFLWFCTSQGLARFDGYGFAVYGPGQGLPAPSVTDLVETPAGNYWVATSGGLFRFRPGDTGLAPSKPAVIPTRGGVNVLRLGPGNTLWVGTGTGLFRMEADGDPPRAPVRVDLNIPESPIYALLPDRLGALWIGGSQGLIRRGQDGGLQRFGEEHGVPGVGALVESRSGHIWIGTGNGLFRLTPAADPKQNRLELIYREPGQSRTWVPVIWEEPDGRMLAAMQPRIAEFPPDARPGAAPVWKYTARNGLLGTVHRTIAQDVAGNLWIGGESRGAIRIARGGFVSYDLADGLGGSRGVL